jgi:hypothetical protein
MWHLRRCALKDLDGAWRNNIWMEDESRPMKSEKVWAMAEATEAEKLPKMAEPTEAKSQRAKVREGSEDGRDDQG